jgi:hypothetical protein
MKHGILITAYKDIDSLVDLVNSLGPEAGVFIHLDRKSQIPTSELERLACLPPVKLISRRYRVNWASTNHLRSILELARVAAQMGGWDYVHLISGSDYPLTSWTEFDGFFERHRGSQFLEHFPLPTRYWGDDGGWSRLTYYHPLDAIDARRSGRTRLLDLLLRAQQRLRVERSLRALPPVYGGCTWWSLTGDCVTYVLEHCARNPHYLRRFHHTRCSEEIFFQTLIMNSPFAGTVVNDNLRYIDWRWRNGSYPAILDETDVTRILGSGKLFARKIERPTSDKLREHMRRHVRPTDRHITF